MLLLTYLFVLLLKEQFATNEILQIQKQMPAVNEARIRTPRLLLTFFFEFTKFNLRPQVMCFAAKVIGFAAKCFDHLFL